MAKEDRGFASMDRSKQRESPARAARPRIRRAPRTSGRAKRRVRPVAKAAWRAIAASRNSSSESREDRAAVVGNPNPEQMVGTDSLP